MRLRTTAAVAVAAYAARTLAARRIERAVAARLPLGSGGVVRGAGTVDLVGSGGRAVLLFHGFGDTPQTLSYLAAHLHALGWSVRVPLLPGHGRTLREFVASGADRWIGAARAEYRSMCARYGSGCVAVGGLSMGGALALVIAGEEEAAVPALALLAPYTSMPPNVLRIARLGGVLDLLLPYLAGRSTQSIRDPAERTRSLAYGVTSPRLVRELYRVACAARAVLPRVAAPVLVVHARHDHRISNDAAVAGFAALGSAHKELLWLDDCGHVVTVDYGREQLFDALAAWLDRTLPAVHAAGPA